VRSVRIRRPENCFQSAPPSASSVSDEAAENTTATQEMPSLFSDVPVDAAANVPGRTASKCALEWEFGRDQVLVAPKRARISLPTHVCGCAVHLISHTGSIVHVPHPDFVIGRNPKCSNLTLDSPLVPNMVSRKHAMIASVENGTDVVDCKSLNGTWLNGCKVERERLRQGDVVTIGNPAQVPADFRFSISMPRNMQV